jgi:phosphoribosyl 1,2-cyclic phosphodiesterase
MFVLSLQSGSNGNCIYVETSRTRLLFDAGISGLQAEQRLAAFGRDIRGVDALIISHDHADHARCAGIFHRKYGLPVYVSVPTYHAANHRGGIGTMQAQHFVSGEALRFGDLSVETVRTPHDAADGVAFVVTSGEARLGILTDLGHCFEGLRKLIASLDAVFMESNYDPEMLANGPYPAFLQKRIRGPGGHLSNPESAGLLREESRRLKWVCLAHLSENNNRPELALETHRASARGDYALHAAGRYEPTGPFEI